MGRTPIITKRRKKGTLKPTSSPIPTPTSSPTMKYTGPRLLIPTTAPTALPTNEPTWSPTPTIRTITFESVKMMTTCSHPMMTPQFQVETSRFKENCVRIENLIQISCTGGPKGDFTCPVSASQRATAEVTSHQLGILLPFEKEEDATTSCRTKKCYDWDGGATCVFTFDLSISTGLPPICASPTRFPTQSPTCGDIQCGENTVLDPDTKTCVGICASGAAPP